MKVLVGVEDAKSSRAILQALTAQFAPKETEVRILHVVAPTTYFAPPEVAAEYTAPVDACTSFKALYEALREFEADLHQHVHLENNVLFPRAVELEASAT